MHRCRILPVVDERCMRMQALKLFSRVVSAYIGVWRRESHYGYSRSHHGCFRVTLWLLLSCL